MTLKTIRPVLLLTIIFSAHHCRAQTQQEMNEQAVGMYNTSDQELNRVYRSVLREYKEDTTFLRRFREAQRIWLQFRDAEMLARFPEREPGYYGSIHFICRYQYLKELTDERVAKLKLWLTGIEEGDACAGSVKTR